jgi:hypothetical protein
MAAQALAEDAVVAEEENAVQLREEEVHAQLEQARQRMRSRAGMQAGHGLGLEEGKQQAGAEWQHRFDDYMAQQAARREQLQACCRLHSVTCKHAAAHGPECCNWPATSRARWCARSCAASPRPCCRWCARRWTCWSAEAARHGAPESPGLGALQERWAAQPKIEWLADASVKPGDAKVESAGAKWTAAWTRWRVPWPLGLVSTWYDGDLPMANDTDMPVADQLQRFLQLGRER